MQRDSIRFDKGAILRKEMLESMYQYPRILTEGYFSGYSDGILYGLAWKEEDEKHILSPGALKYKSEIYFQPEPIVLEDLREKVSSGGEYYVCFQELPVKSSYSQNIFELELVLTKEPVENGFCCKYIKYECGRFSFLDKKKICGVYASPDPDSFCMPVEHIRQEAAPEIERKTTRHPLDYALLQYVYESKPVPIKLVKLYIDEYNNSLSDGISKPTIDASPDNMREMLDALVKAAKELIPPAAVQSASKTPEPETPNRSSGFGGML